VFDRILAASAHPFLQLDLPASAVAAGRTAELMSRFAQHYEDRYGAPELRAWYFELGQAASPADLNLYRTAAAALKAVDSSLRVGGPAELLNGAPAVAGPVDFVSAQYFPSAALPVAATTDELRRLRARVAGSGFSHAELEVSEWSSSASARDFTHDSLPAAAWILKNNLESLDLADALAYRAFTDLAVDEGAGTGIFHGGCGLITYQGVVKPAFHAYRYLNALGDELLQAAPGGVISRRKNSGRVVVLAYNCPPEQTLGLPRSESLAAADELSHRGSPRALSINLSGLRPGGQILIEMLQFDHGNATEAWERMGSPPEPSRPAIAALQSGAREMRLEYRQADELGRFALNRSLDPWAVLLLREL
jgi:xylan 1,4-beta-xylosidase